MNPQTKVDKFDAEKLLLDILVSSDHMTWSWATAEQHDRPENHEIAVFTLVQSKEWSSRQKIRVAT
jgi:hypothetical protein